MSFEYHNISTQLETSPLAMKFAERFSAQVNIIVSEQAKDTHGSKDKLSSEFAVIEDTRGAHLPESGHDIDGSKPCSPVDDLLETDANARQAAVTVGKVPHEKRVPARSGFAREKARLELQQQSEELDCQNEDSNSRNLQAEAGEDGSDPSSSVLHTHESTLAYNIRDMKKMCRSTDNIARLIIFYQFNSVIPGASMLVDCHWRFPHINFYIEKVQCFTFMLTTLDGTALSVEMREALCRMYEVLTSAPAVLREMSLLRCTSAGLEEQLGCRFYFKHKKPRGILREYLLIKTSVYNQKLLWSFEEKLRKEPCYKAFLNNFSEGVNEIARLHQAQGLPEYKPLTRNGLGQYVHGRRRRRSRFGYLKDFVQRPFEGGYVAMGYLAVRDKVHGKF